MTAKILSGSDCAHYQHTQLQQKIQQRIAAGKAAPGLAAILIGDDPASQIYVHNKRLICEKVGIKSFAYDLPASTDESSLLTLIDELNANQDIHGILVQLPLPSTINTQKIIEKISPLKDVDGFHPYNLGRLAQAQPALRPCTPYGIIQLLMHYDIPLSGLHAVIVGASPIVGRPMALELLMTGCTVTICHSQTTALAEHVKQADLLISAIGKRHVILTDWIKPNAIVIDVGIHRLVNGEICGDIDFTSAQQKASWITPVPGGVGPMTVAMLMANTLAAAEIGSYRHL